MSNEQRQATRGNDGRYKNMPTCPRCGKRRTLEPAYTVREGGIVKNDSKWADEFICGPCVVKESK